MKTRELRAARENELQELIELGRRSWLSAFAQTAPFALIAWWAREDRTARWYQEYWPQMIVLEQGGTVIGLVQPMEAEINGLWIHPDHQGTGAGTLLLHEGEESIQRSGHGEAWLTCSGFNRTALRFYQRRGYIETQRLRQIHVCGVETEDIRMERVLSGPSAPGGG